MPDLSVLIPARKEQFLAQTIADLLKNMRGDTEIIAVLDGEWADPPIPDHPRVTLIYHPQAIGQRAAVNEAARLAKGRYLLKCDAHCAFDEGFDIKLLAEYEPGWTVIPRMYNLHAFDWVCGTCGKRLYQGEHLPCPDCQGEMHMDLLWRPRLNRRTDFARFDPELHFQYWRDYEKRLEAQGDLADVLCFVGAAFFLSRERYWELDGLDEGHGSWGQMGVEISCKSWLSGGRMVVNKKTWFAHLFRTQAGFGFPYPISASAQAAARVYSKKLWNLANPNELPNWRKAKHPLRWLVQQFNPPGWEALHVENDPVLHLQHTPA